MGQKLWITTETGKVEMAELLTAVTIKGKEYAVFYFRNSDGTRKIRATYVVQDDQGNDNLKKIDDPLDQKEIDDFIQGMVAHSS